MQPFSFKKYMTMDCANKMHTQLHVFLDDMYIPGDSCICNIMLNAIVATHLIAFKV